MISITTARSIRVLSGLFVFGASLGAASAQTVRSGAGVDNAAIQATVDQFRTDLGANNPANGQHFLSGRREVNWDGVPDNLSSPNLMPDNFFNANSPRGILFSTPGTGLAVSAKAGNPTNTPVEFGDLDPNYTGMFRAFSPQRLFTAIGSNIVDVTFVVAGTNDAALTRGFGSVFTDVDLDNSTSIEYFDVNNQSLGKFFAAPGGAVNESMSFLGVFWDDSIVSRARITSGSQDLGPGHLEGDIVAMDDFIYGEPQAVPEPATMAALGLGALALIRKKRKSA